MLRIVCKSKIQGCRVTGTNLEYIGSITIDSALLEAADILPNERVQIVNLNNGSRVETYVMEGKKNSGEICMNGAAARWAQVGDRIIIISYVLMETKEAVSYKPKVVFVDEKNRVKRSQV